jgi:hypothetical protein
MLVIIIIIGSEGVHDNVLTYFTNSGTVHQTLDDTIMRWKFALDIKKKIHGKKVE